MKRKIRLTESEFHSLVRRLVKETQEEMNTEMSEMDSFENEENEETDGMSKEDTVHAVANFFKRKLRRLDE
jgi:hypothetical protein